MPCPSQTSGFNVPNYVSKFKMLEPIIDILNSQRIILASGSPRREEILKCVGLKFEVCPSLYEESLDPNTYKCHADFVLDTARNKVQEVADRLNADGKEADIIIGADTVVSMDGKIYGKPKDERRAIQMLSGRVHTVFTGVILRSGTCLMKFSESTNVFMTPMSEEIIKAYVKTGEPLVMSWHGTYASRTSRVLSVASLYWLKMDTPITAPAECEVRSVIKFLNAQGIAPIEIDRQLCQIYGPKVMSKQMVRCCCRQFSAGCQNVHDKERSGRPNIITDDPVEQCTICLLMTLGP
ncbi:hypothetical protein ANN_14133 [Periplaneta americana]|uniref:Uncharacterized protein n=1 Tax=Periplaneta americana TaxID=6978 RepID=A0ABQ8SVG1_PERAM|nr:hypothetical protein ANN_14133 [Periplaneta americana]